MVAALSLINVVLVGVGLALALRFGVQAARLTSCLDARTRHGRTHRRRPAPHLRRQPDPQGRLADAESRRSGVAARTLGQRQDHAAARGRRASRRRTRARSASATRPCSTARRGIDVPAEGRNLGLVFQSYALWPHKTVFDNVAYGLKLRKIADDGDQDARDDGAGAALARAPGRALSAPALGRPAAARRARARARLQPAGDPAGRAAVQPRRQAARRGARVAARADRAACSCRRSCVTHDQSEAMAMSDRILLLNNGASSSRARRRRCTAIRSTLFTADFMGSNNKLDGRDRRSARRRRHARRRRLAAVGRGAQRAKAGAPARR